MGQVFASGGQSVGASASASVFPMNTQDWSPSGWTGWISLQSKGLSRVFSNTTAQEHQFFGIQPSLWSSTYIHGLNSPWGCKGSDTTEPVSLSLLSHPYRTTGKTIALTRWTFVGKVVSAFLYSVLGFPVGSAGKESTCNSGDLALIPVLGRSPGEGNSLPIPVSWPGEFPGLYSPWGSKELDTAEWLSLSWLS